MTTNASNSYLWCDSCRRSFRHEDCTDGACPICGRPVRAIGKFSAILRGLMANELAPSPFASKHRQLIKLIWTSDGMGEQYYRLLAPEMAYNRFEATFTDLLCRGAEEGWVTFVIPPSPHDDESDYKMKVIDEDRFLQEVQTLAGPDAALAEGA